MILDLRFWILDWGKECTQRYSLRGLQFNARPTRHCDRAGVIPAFARRRERESTCKGGFKTRPYQIPVFAGMLFVAVAIASAFTAIVSAGEIPKWKEEWQRVVEAAKKEAQISLYGGQEITHPDIIAAFNKEFPFIKVLTTSGRGGDLLARIISERRADKYFSGHHRHRPQRAAHALFGQSVRTPSRQCLFSRRSRMGPSGTVESTGTRIPKTSTFLCSKGP